MAVFQQISSFIETESLVSLAGSVRVFLPHSDSQKALEDLFREYNVQENINILHRVIQDAQARSPGEQPPAMWREQLPSHAAIAARTIPQLEEETAKLRATLSQVILQAALPRPLLSIP